MRAAVVLPVRHAVETLETTLESLWPQCHAQGAELIVAIAAADPTLPIAQRLRSSYSRLLVEPGSVSVPQLRAVATHATAGTEFVIITEDHCLFPPDWLARLLRAAEEHGSAVTGGGVANGRAGYAGWAQYFTRYALFAPPSDSGWTRSLPGNNACYRREALDGHAELLADGFWEAEFNAAIARDGRFWREGGLEVLQRQVRGPLSYVALRFHHGRCYGARRWAAASAGERRSLLARVLLIPAVLFSRSCRAVLPKRSLRARFLATAPLVAVYQLSWSAGEWTGYLFGAAGSCSLTD